MCEQKWWTVGKLEGVEGSPEAVLERARAEFVAAATAERFEAVLVQADFPDGLLANARQSPEWAGLFGALSGGSSLSARSGT